MTPFYSFKMNNYELLGVTPTSTLDEIKRAYRHAAMKAHPDRGGNKESFQKITDAYHCLKDHLQKKLEAQKATDDFFDSIFEEEDEYNEDLTLKIKIDLIQSYLGSEIEVQYDLLSGKPQTCNLTIPKGVKNNEVIRYGGLGDDSIPLAPRGNLLVQYQVQGHDKFVRRKDDLCSVLTINAIEAMIGTKKKVVGLDGTVYNIEITPGTIPNQEIVIKNRGFYNISSALVGNYVIIIEVDIPEILDPDIKQKLMDLNALIKNN